eukprot:3101181-Amphidinium_carterae.1
MPASGSNSLATSQSVTAQSGAAKRARHNPPQKRQASVKSTPTKLPDGLQGSAKTPQNAAICFAYNLGKCQSKGVGCVRGKHLCTKCFGEHAYINCPSK